MKLNENNKTKRTIPTAEEIAAKGICTTTIDVDIKPDFFNQFAIISYSCQKDRYIPYERLGSKQNLSVVGIKEKWLPNQMPLNRFFVLSKKEDAQDILDNLRSMPDISSAMDDLSRYDVAVQKRIVASLLINSLNRYKETKSTYNYGRLYVMDEQNFHLKKKKGEVVCLSVELNKFLVLTANTVTLTECSSMKQLEKYYYRRACFRYNHALLGENWSGDILSAFTFTKGMDLKFSEIYIQRKRNKKTHNVVSQYRWEEDQLYDDKNGVKKQIVDSVNKHYGQWVTLSFCQFPVMKYSSYTSFMYTKDLNRMMEFYIQGKTVYFENPFALEDSKYVTFMENVKDAMKSSMNFPVNFEDYNKDTYTEGMVVKLAMPKPEKNETEEAEDCNETEEAEDVSYTKNEELSRYQVLQHCVYMESASKKIKEKDKEKENCGQYSQSAAKRMIIELMVKEAVAKGKLHHQLASLIEGWEFYLFRNIDEYIYGASMQSSPDGSVQFQSYNGMEDENYETDCEFFIEDVLTYRGTPKWLDLSSVYRIMKKGGNIYLIIDTDENPIVDSSKMESLYETHREIEKSETGESVAYQKNALNEMRCVGNVHDYIKGVFGFRMWERNAIIGDLPTFSYIVGVNTGKNLPAMHHLQKMPRTKRIVILQANNKEAIPTHLEEFESMLKQIFGRYNEMECYPFPFKFLQEYLDRSTLIRKGIHWSSLKSEKENE